MSFIEKLHKEFPLSQLAFSHSAGSAVVVAVDNIFATASISLAGGHVLTWQPKSSSEPVIWLSEQAKIALGKSIRGGVPVCWPWFGAHSSEPDYPAHGYVRTAAWQMVEARQLDSGETQITLELASDESVQRFGPEGAQLRLSVTVGERLQIALITTNDSGKSFELGEALHTYFHISDVASVSVLGLDGVEYLDKVDDFARKTQVAEIGFDGETDRVYLNTEADCIIDDKGLDRRIHIAKTGSASTVVWSPGLAKAEAMGDLGENDGWRKMVCVESANAAENTLQIEAGTQHCLSVEYWLS